MKQAYDCFTEAGGLFFGFLVVGKDVDGEGIFRTVGFDIHSEGIFHAILIYFPKEGGTTLKEFYSVTSAEDAVSEADRWIKTNLYPDFVKGAGRSLGSHIV